MTRVSRVLGNRSAMRSALSVWIGRVVELKERELVTWEHADRQFVACVLLSSIRSAPLTGD